MTAAQPIVNLTAANPDDGCVFPGCGRRSTLLLHPYKGRLCPDHATIPPGPYRRDLSDDMVSLGRADCAWAYLRVWLTAEIDRRFAGVAL